MIEYPHRVSGLFYQITLGNRRLHDRIGRFIDRYEYYNSTTIRINTKERLSIFDIDLDSINGSNFFEYFLLNP